FFLFPTRRSSDLSAFLFKLLLSDQRSFIYVQFSIIVKSIIEIVSIFISFYQIADFPAWANYFWVICQKNVLFFFIVVLNKYPVIIYIVLPLNNIIMIRISPLSFLGIRTIT